MLTSSNFSKSIIKLLFIFVIVSITSCKKDDPEPLYKPGFLEGLIKDSPSITISQKSETHRTLPGKDYGVYRGYHIIPSKDIKISAIGCKVPERGDYELYVFTGAWYDFMMGEYIYKDNITITKENEFQYKEVNQDVILSANGRYLLLYFKKNPKSFFEATFKYSASNPDNNPRIPYMHGDIEINSLFYYQGIYDNGSIYYQNDGGLLGGPFRISGLVDFKYEMVN